MTRLKKSSGVIWIELIFTILLLSTSILQYQRIDVIRHQQLHILIQNQDHWLQIENKLMKHLSQPTTNLTIQETSTTLNSNNYIWHQLFSNTPFETDLLIYQEQPYD